MKDFQVFKLVRGVWEFDRVERSHGRAALMEILPKSADGHQVKVRQLI